MNSESNEMHGAKGLKRPSARACLSNGSALAARSQKEITIHELWQILLRRRGTFLACFTVATLAALVVSLILPARYEAVGRLTVDFESSDSFGWEAMARATGGVDPGTKLQTQVNILESDALAWDVIKRLRLDQRPETAHRKYAIGPAVCVSAPNQQADSISPECRRVLLDEFHDRLRVQSLQKTEIIEIRYRCKSRELAATVVNTLADIYVEWSFQTKYQAAVRASNWLSGQLDDVKKDAELAEEKFIAYQKLTGIIGTDENHNILIERLNALNQQLVVAEAERIAREARYRVALNGDPEALAGITPGSTLQVLHTQEAELKNQYAQLDAKYGAAYPRVVQLKEQLAQAAEATRAELDHTRDKIKDEYDAALKSETLLRNEYEQQKQQAYDTNEAAIQAAILKRDVDASNELYEQLVKRLKEAGILAGIRGTNVTMIDPAGIPVSHAEPRPMRNVVLGMFAGSLFGLMLCALFENLDTRIATPSDVTDICALPALGIVPTMTNGMGIGRLASTSLKDGATRIVALELPESEMADAYRSLRTALLLSTAGTPPKVLLVTSALPREGKTTTSVNTAVVFAQKNRRVLLVDGDLRRADVHRTLGVAHNGGLSAALVGEEPSKFYISYPDLPSLVILPAGNRPPKPPDLLDSDRMRELVSVWRQEFDQVIIDAPPVLGLSDAVILSTMVDTVVLVVRAKQSRRQDICRTWEILANVDAHVGGAIINDFDVHRLAYYGEPSLYNHYFSGNGRTNGKAKI